MGLSNTDYIRNAKNPHIAGKIAKPPPLGEENRKKKRKQAAEQYHKLPMLY